MGKRKAPVHEDAPNHDFCAFLTELADYEKNVTRNIHKYNTYRKAASVLGLHPTRITSGSEARKLSGIGEKIGQKIDEFLETGKLRKLEAIHGDGNNAAISLLTRVSGIGPAKALTLISEGVTTLEGLHKHIDKLTHHQIIGLKYFDDFEVKIPRMEVKQIEAVLKNQLNDLDPLIELTICGSHRRGKPHSGDIDVLLTHPDCTSGSPPSDLLKKCVNMLSDCGLITETISLGAAKFMGACKLCSKAVTRRLDLRLVPHDQYFCGILYFTGSDLFNREMRAHALEKGFTLNEYSLRPVGSTGVPGEPLEITSERDVFDCIEFAWREPHERDK